MRGWAYYKEANRLYADVTASVWKEGDAVLVMNYANMVCILNCDSGPCA